MNPLNALFAEHEQAVWPDAAVPLRAVGITEQPSLAAVTTEIPIIGVSKIHSDGLFEAEAVQPTGRNDARLEQPS